MKKLSQVAPTSIDRASELNIKYSKIHKQAASPKLDTLQTHCHVERVLFYSFTGSVLSDMKAKRTIGSKLDSELLVKLMISMALATAINQEPMSKANDPEPDVNDDYQTAPQRDMTATQSKTNPTGLGLSKCTFKIGLDYK